MTINFVSHHSVTDQCSHKYVEHRWSCGWSTRWWKVQVLRWTKYHQLKNPALYYGNKDENGFDILVHVHVRTYIHTWWRFYSVEIAALLYLYVYTNTAHTMYHVPRQCHAVHYSLPWTWMKGKTSTWYARHSQGGYQYAAESPSTFRKWSFLSPSTHL